MQETFGGVSVRENYPWEGDTGKFRINDGELQLWEAEKGEALLSLYGVSCRENAWSFMVRNEYGGTTANYVCVYLWSLSAEEKKEAVYVRLGYTKKNISLCWRKETGKIDVLIEGRSLFEGPQEVEVKVEVTENGHFVLYSKVAGESRFVQEGVTNLTLPDEIGYFMIEMKYSANHGQDKFVDDVTIVQFQPTKEEPEREPVFPEAGMLIISEVMAAPKVVSGLTETEYVELWNLTDNPLILTGCSFNYGGRKVDLGGGTLDGGSYMVLYRSGKNITIDEGGIRRPLADFPAQLADAGEVLSILDAEGHVIDSIWYHEAKAGRSWEREGEWWYLSSDIRGGTPGSINSVSEGERFPVLPSVPEEPVFPEEPEREPVPPEAGMLIISEVMADPKGVSGLAETEYVELWNLTDNPLILTGCSFNYDKMKVDLGGGTLDGGSYMVLYRSGKNITIDEGGIERPLAKFPAQLVNTGEVLSILDAEGHVIDSVWYHEAKAGRSWEREGEWWHLSSDSKGGTPGAPNSLPKGEKVPVLPSNTEPPTSIDTSFSNEKPDQTISILPPTYDHARKLYLIPYHVDRSGYKCKFVVYDVEGHQWAILPIFSLWNLQGEEIWDGCNEKGERLPYGVYIFYAEVYHKDGIVRHFKQAFLVHPSDK
ncbi:MAG: lamin tail domain-containing protein [Tannerellaceae bacterium]|nr:lamin tail domain-containing protein [Tannerellaceae bacterium]